MLQHKNAPILGGFEVAQMRKTSVQLSKKTGLATFYFQQNAAILAGTENAPILGGFGFARLVPEHVTFLVYCMFRAPDPHLQDGLRETPFSSEVMLVSQVVD